MAYLITSKTRTDGRPHGKTLMIRGTDGGKKIVDERQAERMTGFRGVPDPEPIKGLREDHVMRPE